MYAQATVVSAFEPLCALSFGVEFQSRESIKSTIFGLNFPALHPARIVDISFAVINVTKFVAFISEARFDAEDRHETLSTT